jgi:hypothetical protein
MDTPWRRCSVRRGRRERTTARRAVAGGAAGDGRSVRQEQRSELMMGAVRMDAEVVMHGMDMGMGRQGLAMAW